MGYLSNIKKQYLISFFHALIPAYVIERLFWQERGMDVQMVVYCEMIYALTVTLLEVPSGILADRFGRKRLLVLNGVLSVLEFVLLLFAQSFWAFGLVMLLSGVGKACTSGSQNALLYDSLLIEHKQDEFEKLLGRLSAVDFTGSMLAALSGGVLANFFGLEFNYVISCGSMLLALLLSFSLKEPPMVTKPQSELSGAIEYTKQALVLLAAEPLVLLYSVSGAVLGACLLYLDEFWQLILEESGIPLMLFGVVLALEMSFRILGSLLAYKLKEKFRYRSILSALIAINAIGYMIISRTRNVFCLIPILAVSWAAGITEPLITGYLHHHTESHIRATVESFASLGLRFLSMLVGLAFGFVSTRYSIFHGFAVLAAVCGGYLLLFIPFSLKDL